MASFSDKLTAELAARNMGRRTLAKLVAPDNVEQARRAIRRWADGTHKPSRANADSITDALGLERGALDSDDEEDVMAPLMREIGAAVLRNARSREALRTLLEVAS
jgi:hypothetical protein